MSLTKQFKHSLNLPTQIYTLLMSIKKVQNKVLQMELEVKLYQKISISNKQGTSCSVLVSPNNLMAP